MRQRFGSERCTAEGLGDKGVTALGRPGCGSFTESRVAGVADDDQSAGHLRQRQVVRRRPYPE